MANPEVEEIKSQIGQLQSKLKSAQLRLKDAQFRATGLSVGQVIMVQSHSGIDTYMISVTGWGDYNCVGGVKIKKDGTAGKQSAGYIPKWRELTPEEQQKLGNK